MENTGRIKDRNQATKNLSSIMNVYTVEPLTKEEEAEIFKNPTIENRNRLFNSYLPFLRKMSRDYCENPDEETELMNVAFLGMYNAFKLFDYTKNVKFYTYAVHSIEDEIVFFRRDKELIRKHKGIQRADYHIERFRDDFFKTNGYYPDTSLILEYLDTIKVITYDKDCLTETRVIFPEAQSASSEEYCEQSVLDTEMASENDYVKQSEDEDNKKTVFSYINKLSKNEQLVIVRSFGIGCDAESDYSISLRLNCKESKVVSLKERAIKHMQMMYKTNVTI